MISSKFSGSVYESVCIGNWSQMKQESIPVGCGMFTVGGGGAVLSRGIFFSVMLCKCKSPL